MALTPKLVVILAGTNDVANGIAANQIEDNLTMMGDLARAHGIKPVFASLLPVGDYHKDADPRYEMTKTHSPAAILAINRWIQSLCLTQGFAYMDYFSVMVDPMGQMKADLSDDGLNPNSRGYRVMSPVTLTTIDRALAHSPGESEENHAKRRSLIPGK
jgi:lysophospholipase L1-like esterase